MSALGTKLEKLLDAKTKQNKYVEFEKKEYEIYEASNTFLLTTHRSVILLEQSKKT